MIDLRLDKGVYNKTRLPVVFTEHNWSDLPNAPPDPKGSQFCSNTTGCEGDYLVDLFTWLYDSGYSNNPADKHSVRVAWYRGADSDRALGIYTPNGVEKAPPQRLAYCPAAHIAPLYLSRSYYLLRSGACYPAP